MKFFTSQKDLNDLNGKEGIDKGLNLSDQEIEKLFLDSASPLELKNQFKERYDKILLERKRQDELAKTKRINELFFQGDDLLQQNDFEQALKKYEEGFAIRPNSLELKNCYNQKLEKLKEKRKDDRQNKWELKKKLKDDLIKQQEKEQLQKKIEESEKGKFSASNKEIHGVDNGSKKLSGRNKINNIKPYSGAIKYVAAALIAVFLYTKYEVKNKWQNHSQSKEIAAMLATDGAQADSNKNIKQPVSQGIKETPNLTEKNNSKSVVGRDVLKIKDKYYLVDDSGNALGNGYFLYLGKAADDVFMLCTTNQKYVYINKFGTQVGGEYDVISGFKGNIAVVKKDNNWFYINKQGKQIGGPYKFANDFSEGKGVANIYDKDYIFDENGNQLYGPFEHATRFRNGLAAVKVADKRTYINHKGQQVLGEFDHAYNFYNDLAVVVIKGKSYLIDKNGNKKLGPIRINANISEGFISITKNGKDYYINLEGKNIGGPYNYALFFSEGMAVVKIEDKYYFIDQNGNKKIGPYQDVWSFSEGIASVKKSNLRYFIDKTGKILFGGYDEVGFCINGLITAELNKTKYILDKSGNVLYKTSDEKMIKFVNSLSQRNLEEFLKNKMI